MEDVVEASRLPVIASGGVATLDDLARARRLAACSAAVIGMALYTGALDPRVVARSSRQ